MKTTCTTNRYLYPALLFLCFWLPSQAIGQSVSVSGYTEPYLDSTLGMSEIGQVSKILVKEGDKVKQWQALLELNQEAETLEMKRRQILFDSKAEVQAVSQQLKTLKAHLEATRELYKTTGSVPREELENQELEHALTEIELIRLQQAEDREEMELKIAQKELQRRTLRAPFSGEIAKILVQLGENCELDTELVQLVNTSKGYFVANVELALSQQMSLGQEVNLEFQAGQEPITKLAKIVFISPVVDPASGLRTIKAEFDNQDNEIIPGVAGAMILNTQSTDR